MELNVKVILKMDVFEVIEWVGNHHLTMAYLYALERNGIFKSHKEKERLK